MRIRNLGKLSWLCVALLLICGCVGCGHRGTPGGKTKRAVAGAEALVGRWQSQKDAAVTWEFTTDGRMIVTSEGASRATGSYWVEGDRLRMLAPPPSDMGTTQRFIIAGETLTLENGSSSVFKRVK